MPVTRHAFSADGKIDEFVLSNKAGTEVYVTTWGARLTRFIVKDKAGKARDIVAGFESYEKWQESLAISDPYFGATVGRVAGRISPSDSVKVGNQVCCLGPTQPGNVCLHGGEVGFDKKVFAAQVVGQEPVAAVRFSYVSADGEEGFPGEVELNVTYSLHQDNALHLEYKGRLLSGTESVLNPTNHTYWNLTGFEEPTIHNHRCQLPASSYMVTGTDQVPTGDIEKVAGTCLDFTGGGRRFGDGLDSFDRGTLRGYDHIFVVGEEAVAPVVREVARVSSLQSGLTLVVLSNQPALVVYTGNWISDRLVGKNRVRYGNHAAVALEAQRFPNAVNIPRFRSQTAVTPDKPFLHHTVYRVDVLL